MSRPQDLAEAVVLAELGHELLSLNVPTGHGDHLPGQGSGLLDQVGQLNLDFSLPDRDAERAEGGHDGGVGAVAAGDVVAGVPGPTDVSDFLFFSFFFFFYLPFHAILWQAGLQEIGGARAGHVEDCFFFSLSFFPLRKKRQGKLRLSFFLCSKKKKAGRGGRRRARRVLEFAA
jgi:hypothetical protein